MSKPNANKETQSLRQKLQYPDWYIRLEKYLKTEIFPIVHDNPELQSKRNVFYGLVEEMLENGKIPLASDGPDLDHERQTIDTIIIHHTEEDPNISLGRLSAIGLVRQYAAKYLEGNVWGHRGLKGQPIWSGHFGDGKIVFFAYHWLVRPDGKTERLLEDKYIARHSGDIATRSIGVAFSGNYEHSVPPSEQIEGVAQIIKENYSFVYKSRIFGHLEVMRDRTCPGDKFLGDWKNTLLESLD